MRTHAKKNEKVEKEDKNTRSESAATRAAVEEVDPLKEKGKKKENENPNNERAQRLGEGLEDLRFKKKV